MCQQAAKRVIRNPDFPFIMCNLHRSEVGGPPRKDRVNIDGWSNRNIKGLTEIRAESAKRADGRSMVDSGGLNRPAGQTPRESTRQVLTDDSWHAVDHVNPFNEFCQ